VPQLLNKPSPKHEAKVVKTSQQAGTGRHYSKQDLLKPKPVAIRFFKQPRLTPSGRFQGATDSKANYSFFDFLRFFRLCSGVVERELSKSLCGQFEIGTWPLDFSDTLLQAALVYSPNGSSITGSHLKSASVGLLALDCADSV